MEVFGEVGKTIVSIVSLIALIAIVSVLVSRKAQTPQVIQAAGSALGNNVAVAISPVTGSQYRIDLSYPGEVGGFGYGWAGGPLG